jgi:catechol 2,3-dioxygenase-like lactoylglutathione lyase family enzyme
MCREARLRLELFALDMEASIAFYTRVLAFELARHEPGDYASLRLGVSSRHSEGRLKPAPHQRKAETTATKKTVSTHSATKPARATIARSTAKNPTAHAHGQTLERIVLGRLGRAVCPQDGLRV